MLLCQHHGLAFKIHYTAFQSADPQMTFQYSEKHAYRKRFCSFARRYVEFEDVYKVIILYYR